MNQYLTKTKQYLIKTKKYLTIFICFYSFKNAIEFHQSHLQDNNLKNYILDKEGAIKQYYNNHIYHISFKKEIYTDLQKEVIEINKKKIENLMAKCNDQKFLKNPTSFYSQSILPLSQFSTSILDKIFRELSFSFPNDIENITQNLSEFPKFFTVVESPYRRLNPKFRNQLLRDIPWYHEEIIPLFLSFFFLVRSFNGFYFSKTLEKSDFKNENDFELMLNFLSFVDILMESWQNSKHEIKKNKKMLTDLGMQEKDVEAFLEDLEISLLRLHNNGASLEINFAIKKNRAIRYPDITVYLNYIINNYHTFMMAVYLTYEQLKTNDFYLTSLKNFLLFLGYKADEISDSTLENFMHQNELLLKITQQIKTNQLENNLNSLIWNSLKNNPDGKLINMNDGSPSKMTIQELHHFMENPTTNNHQNIKNGKIGIPIKIVFSKSVKFSQDGFNLKFETTLDFLLVFNLKTNTYSIYYLNEFTCSGLSTFDSCAQIAIGQSSSSFERNLIMNLLKLQKDRETNEHYKKLDLTALNKKEGDMPLFKKILKEIEERCDLEDFKNKFEEYNNKRKTEFFLYYSDGIAPMKYEFAERIANLNKKDSLDKNQENQLKKIIDESSKFHTSSKDITYFLHEVINALSRGKKYLEKIKTENNKDYINEKIMASLDFENTVKEYFEKIGLNLIPSIMESLSKPHKDQKKTQEKRKRETLYLDHPNEMLTALNKEEKAKRMIMQKLGFSKTKFGEIKDIELQFDEIIGSVKSIDGLIEIFHKGRNMQILTPLMEKFFKISDPSNKEEYQEQKIFNGGLKDHELMGYIRGLKCINKQNKMEFFSDRFNHIVGLMKTKYTIEFNEKNKLLCQIITMIKPSDEIHNSLQPTLHQEIDKLETQRTEIIISQIIKQEEKNMLLKSIEAKLLPLKKIHKDFNKMSIDKMEIQSNHGFFDTMIDNLYHNQNLIYSELKTSNDIYKLINKLPCFINESLIQTIDERDLFYHILSFKDNTESNYLGLMYYLSSYNHWWCLKFINRLKTYCKSTALTFPQNLEFFNRVGLADLHIPVLFLLSSCATDFLSECKNFHLLRTIGHHNFSTPIQNYKYYFNVFFFYDEDYCTSPAYQNKKDQFFKDIIQFNGFRKIIINKENFDQYSPQDYDNNYFLLYAFCLNFWNKLPMFSEFFLEREITQEWTNRNFAENFIITKAMVEFKKIYPYEYNTLNKDLLKEVIIFIINITANFLEKNLRFIEKYRESLKKFEHEIKKKILIPKENGSILELDSKYLYYTYGNLELQCTTKIGYYTQERLK
jgi:hypothetical protein